MQSINLYYYHYLIKKLTDNTTQLSIISWIKSVPKFNFFYCIYESNNMNEERIYIKLFYNYVIVVAYEFPLGNTTTVLNFALINNAPHDTTSHMSQARSDDINQPFRLKLIGFGQDSINGFYNPAMFCLFDQTNFRKYFYYHYFPEFNCGYLLNNLEKYGEQLDTIIPQNFEKKYQSLLNFWRRILAKNKIKAHNALLDQILHKDLVYGVMKYLYPQDIDSSTNTIFI